MIPPDSAEVLNIFVDESSQNNHRFLVLGGIVCKPNTAAVLSHNIAEARLPELPQSELKWTKVSASKLAAYKRVVDRFFHCPHLVTPVEFHCLTVPLTRRNEHFYNGGSREIGFNKEIYQLLMKFGRLHKECLFHVYPDRRETNSSLEELRLILNRGIRKSGDRRDWPYRRLHFRHSHDEALLQLTDLFIGAIAFHLNGHRQLPNASPAKCEFSDYILAKAGVRDVFRDTAMRGKFTIWHRRLKGVPQS